ncbi:MAG: hypothetical protein C4291_02205 [Candidatus Dadabacteria bacterium]
MKTKNIFTLLTFIVCILTISLLTSGGCGINFGNDNNNGGDGNTGSDSVQGTITSITNVGSTSGITVQATDSSNTFSATTNSNGFFKIEGNFSGSSLRLDFLNQSNNLLATTSVTIFPGIEIDLGNITISNGNVNLSGSINITFDGDISENNCSGNAGTIVVAAGNTDVIVQVLTSTTIVDSNNNTLSCGNLSSGKVTVTGTLLMGNTVKANRIELQ